MKLVINNTYTQILYEPNTSEFARYGKILRDYLRVKVDGAFWASRGGWDGYRYFITDKGTFATGFLPNVLEYLKECGAAVSIDDQRTNVFEFKQEFQKSVQLWDLRDYQEDIVQKANNWISGPEQPLFFPRGIVDAATNAGKNSVIAGITLNAVNPKVIMMCKGVETYKEAVKFFSKMFTVGEINPNKYHLTDFTIAMQKTLYNRAKASLKVRADLGRFNILFTDECHEAGSSQYSRLLTWIDAYGRYLVSGTPLDMDSKVSKMIIVGLAGPILAKISNKFLIDAGVSLRPKIKMFLNRPRGNARYFTYDEEYDNVVKFSKERADIMVQQLLKAGDQKTLVAFNEKNHGEFIYDYLWQVPELRPKLEWVHGEDQMRDIKVQAFKDNRVRILVSSLILKQSFNIPDINNLCYALGGKAKVTLKQLIGRVVRDDGVSSHVEGWDFYDCGKWVEEHSKKRIKIYRGEEFDITFDYPHKPNGTLIRNG